MMTFIILNDGSFNCSSLLGWLENTFSDFCEILLIDGCENTENTLQKISGFNPKFVIFTNSNWIVPFKSENWKTVFVGNYISDFSPLPRADYTVSLLFENTPEILQNQFKKIFTI